MGYPLVVSANTKDLKILLLNELYETILQRDIIDKYSIRKSTVLKAFINGMLESACRVVSAQTMTNYLSSQMILISQQNGFKYLKNTHNIFLFFFLYPYSKKPKQRNTRPTLYLPDLGLMQFANQDVSKRLGNQIFIELRKKTITELIQVCYSLKMPYTYTRETESLLKASDVLKCNKRSILTLNKEKTLKIKDKVIKVIPAWKWMLR